MSGSDETAPPSFDADRLQQMFDASPFIAGMGLEALAVSAEDMAVEVRMAMAPQLERTAGSNQFHGGPIASLIDTAGDFAVGLAVGGGVPTIDLRVDYLRPAFGPHITAKATARRVGRTVGIADVDVFGADGKLVAIGRGCYSAKRG